MSGFIFFQSGTNIDRNRVIRKCELPGRLSRKRTFAFFFFPNCFFFPYGRAPVGKCLLSMYWMGCGVAGDSCGPRRDWAQLCEHGQAENPPVFYQGQSHR